ncbi:MAG: DUF4932 domain-containing protein [Bacteroidota bacterium]
MQKNILLSLLLLVGTTLAHAQMPVIKASSSSVDIRDGDYLSKGNWTLMPDLKPDPYETTVEKSKTVTFYTDIDSISFKVKPNKTYDFVILLNGKDSCWTRIVANQYTPPAVFSKKYIKANKGKFAFDVPEVQELVHIIMAITPKGIEDHNMVNHNGAYYEKVIEHFGEFKNEAIVASVNELLENGLYARLKMDACGFLFEKDKIAKKTEYNRMNWGNSNYMEPLLANLEAFAKKTNFRTFFKENTPYYQQLISLLAKQTPIQPQWDWLEKNFPNRYDHYYITFSPLVYGSHSTNRFESNGFKQTAMFIAGPSENSKHNEAVLEGLITRMVFTEIDHNYVNPVSDQYLDEINVAFANRKNWVNDDTFARSYGNPYSVFNEYMTWAVFSIYAKERFKPEDFKVINKRVEKQMDEWRGFTNFIAFNQEVLRLYDNKAKDESIADLYPKVLEWCKEQL